ncbi:hypothetical protein LCGC14_0396930 [marine sediment metagenome]|uniref:Uncharacterized protein n=1 Tax=marine sediment metagenome TaxID=412755 RepID=A0A0F9SXU8_9ZZZZ
MSAWIVSKQHIDYLVTEFLRGDHAAIYADDGVEHFHPEDADDIGRDLWSANLESVAYRYPADESGERPGIGVTDEEIRDYTHKAVHGLRGIPFSPYVLFKAVGCYRYQSCEHPGWSGSRADKVSEAMREKAIHLIVSESDIYQSAPWGIDERHVA